MVQDENEQNWTSKLRRKKKPDVTDGPNPNATASEVPRRRWWFNRRRGGELSSDPSKDSVPAAGSSPTGDTKDTHSTPKTKCARFKDAFSRDAHAHFTGAWYVSPSSKMPSSSLTIHIGTLCRQWDLFEARPCLGRTL